MERLNTLLNIPDLFNYKSLLNIGEVPANKHNHNVINFFKNKGYSDITVLEVWEPFVKELNRVSNDLYWYFHISFHSTLPEFPES